MNEDNIINVKNEMKIEKSCRTCLSYEGNFLSLSHSYHKITIAQMIRDLTNLQVDLSDGHSQSICSKCVKETKKAHKFRSKCLESYDTLEQLKNSNSSDVLTGNYTLPVEDDFKKEISETKLEEPEEAIDLLEVKYESEDSLRSNSAISEKEDEDSNTDDSCRKIDKHKRSKVIFDCPLCHGLFSSDLIYDKHINQFHSDNVQLSNLKMKREPLGFVSRDEFSIRNNFVYKCAIDNFVGGSMKEFKNHLKDHYGEKSITCFECDFRTSSIGLLKKHIIQRHTEAKMFSCLECGHQCKTERALKCHSTVHSSEKNYQCKLCPMTFKRSSYLSRHKAEQHDKKKAHVCQICQKAFFRRSKLKTHMVVHTGERPHVCHVCGAGFTQVNNLRLHVSAKHELDKPIVKCHLCHYSTRHKTYLAAHVKKKHSDIIKKFACPQCSFKTTNSNALKVHIMRHTGETNYSCDECDYKCITLFRLNHHKRIHTGERPFPCNLCDYNAISKDSLKRHHQTHCTDLKFVCPKCPFRTNVKETLAKHLRLKCITKKRGRPSLKHSSSMAEAQAGDNMMQDEFKQEN